MLETGENDFLRANRRFAVILCICVRSLVLSLVLVGTVHSQDEPALAPANSSATETGSPTIPLAEALSTKGDLSLQNTSIEKALFTIGSSWNVNIVVGKEVTGTVSCVYKQAPLSEVLDAILLANGYSYRAVGESLVVQKTLDVGSAHPLFRSAAIPITHSDLKEVVDGARLLLSNQGQLQALQSANSILVIDFADRVKSIQEFVAELDAAAARSSGGVPSESYKRLQVAYFHTQFIPVDNTREPLSAILSSAGKLATMPIENRLVVVDYPANIEMARRVLEQIDRPKAQVKITALIYDISLQDVEQLGLNWNSSGRGNTVGPDGDLQPVFTLDTNTLTPFGPEAAGGAFTIQSLTNHFDITTVALALQNAKDARLLADPHITVEENESAVVKSVQEIPFQQLTQAALGGQPVGTTAFKEVGITLDVKPKIASDGTIKMLVAQEFSRVAGFTDPDNQPIIDSRSANTTVRVANRQTLVIGGLRQRSDTGDFNGIPLLKDIRYIGPLFRSRNTIVRESEMIIFLMPEIVGYDPMSQPREYLAQETIHCRLEALPMAEGCPQTLDGTCDSDRRESNLVPVALPPVDERFSHGAQSHHPGYATRNVDNVPFRPGFDDRYRADGGTNPARKRLADSQKNPQPAPNRPRQASQQRFFGW